jgi:hypothetical protein
MNIWSVNLFEEDLDNKLTFNSLSKNNFSPLSQILTVRLLVPKLTTHVTSQVIKHERLFFTYVVFFLIEPMLILH